MIVSVLLHGIVGNCTCVEVFWLVAGFNGEGLVVTDLSGQ